MVLFSKQLLIVPLALLIGHQCRSQRGPRVQNRSWTFLCLHARVLFNSSWPRSGCHALTSIPQAPACTATHRLPPLERHVFSTQPYHTNRCSGEMCFIKPFFMQTEGSSPQPSPHSGVQTSPLRHWRSDIIAAKYNQGDLLFLEEEVPK